MLNYAIIGLGQRGNVLFDSLNKIEDINCIAVCDFYHDRCELIANKFVENNKNKPNAYTDYKECIDKENLDFVIVSSAWISHLEITFYAMKKGVAVGCEVGGAYSIESLWELVRLYEKTKTPVMLLENACYSRIKLLSLNMKRQGLLGELIHLEGSYRHDLRSEIIECGTKNSHYRLHQYLHRNTENYPTHEIGPIAKLLDINCGNRFLSLYSVGSKSKGLKEYIKSRKINGFEDVDFNQSDVVSTVIKCQNGETVTIHLDTSLPRYYSRGFVVEGTKGLISEDLSAVYLDDVNRKEEVFWHQVINNIDEYYKRYEHPVWSNYNPDESGHGGVDYLVLLSFINSLKENRPCPIDVYDMATWMSISVLSEQSLVTGQAVCFPDFTDGKWIERENKFCIDKV